MRAGTVAAQQHQQMAAAIGHRDSDAVAAVARGFERSCSGLEREIDADITLRQHTVAHRTASFSACR